MKGVNLTILTLNKSNFHVPVSSRKESLAYTIGKSDLCGSVLKGDNILCKIRVGNVCRCLDM